MQKRNLLLLALAGLAPLAAHASVLNVTVNTSGLVGHPAAPFYIELQLTDGSGTGDGNNTVVADNFNFGVGGSAGGLFDPALGDVTGDLSSGVTLKDTQFLALFHQSFVPGDLLSFRLNLGENVDDPVPDGFTFSILDSSETPLPTLEPFFQDFIFAADLTGPNPSIQAYGGDTSRSPAAGGDAIQFDVRYALDTAGPPVQTPEPRMLWPLAGLMLAAAFRARGRQAA
jgi:hypothetical protein